MMILKNEIRPIGFVTLELNENEVQTLIGLFEDICFLKQMPLSELKGTRSEIYKTLSATLLASKGEKNV